MTDSEDQPQQPPREARLQIPVKDSSTTIQVSTLLSVIGGLTSSIGNLFMAVDDKGERIADGVDNNVKTSLESSMIRACNRLDHVLDEQQRWAVERGIAIEKMAEAAGKTHQALLEAQLKSILEAQKPHRLYNPQLAKLTDGRHIAFLGDPEKLHLAIRGIGHSAAEALEEFDLAWRQGVKPDPSMDDDDDEEEETHTDPNQGDDA